MTDAWQQVEDALRRRAQEADRKQAERLAGEAPSPAPPAAIDISVRTDAHGQLVTSAPPANPGGTRDVDRLLDALTLFSPDFCLVGNIPVKDFYDALSSLREDAARLDDWQSHDDVWVVPCHGGGWLVRSNRFEVDENEVHQTLRAAIDAVRKSVPSRSGLPASDGGTD